MDQLDPGAAGFSEFFDDAAVFPPGFAALPQAVRSHLERRRTALAHLVGPLLLTPDQVQDAAQVARQVAEASGMDLQSEPLGIGLVVAPGAVQAAQRQAEEPPAGVRIVGLELKTDERWRDQLTAGVTLAQAASFSVHVEISERAVREGGADLLEGTSARLKFRTGGIEAALFPSVAQLAEVIHAAVLRDVPFKLTAGLHEAVRHLGEATGFEHHGFLNIAVAAGTAQRGGRVADVAKEIALDDAGMLVAAYRDGGVGWRSSFESFGTCSVVECVESLVAIDLLDAALLPVTVGEPA